jgi:hypothetical protein
MTDDEALKKSDEKSEIRRARKHAYATNNSDFAQIGSSSSKTNFNFNQIANFNFNQQTLTNTANFNFTPSNNKTSFNFDSNQSNTPPMRGRFFFF